jgi:hypothetical protein
MILHLTKKKKEEEGAHIPYNVCPYMSKQVPYGVGFTYWKACKIKKP